MTDEKITTHHDRVTARLERHPPASRFSRHFKLLFDAPRPHGFLPLCNPHVRRAAGEAMIDAVLTHYVATRAQPQLRHFLFTAVTDTGFTFEYQPHVDIPRMRKRMYDGLRALGLHGICATELDVMSKPLAGERGRRFLVHDHGIMWTTDPAFQPKVAAAKLMERATFSNSLGMPAVSFTSRAESGTRYGNFTRERPDEDQTEGSMAWLAYYILKALACTKNRVPVLGKPDSYRLLGDADHLTQTLALRAAEFYSHLSPFDVVYGVGDGKHVRATFARALRAWEYGNRSSRDGIVTMDRRRMWSHYWARTGHPSYAPWQLTT